MAEKKIQSEPPTVYVANETFYFRGSQLVMAGHTVVAGHPMLKGRMAMFRPFEPTWPLPGKAAPAPVALPAPTPDSADATTEPDEGK